MRDDIAIEVSDVGAARERGTGRAPDAAPVAGRRLDVGHLVRIGVEHVRVYLPAELELDANVREAVRRTMTGETQAPTPVPSPPTQRTPPRAPQKKGRR